MKKVKKYDFLASCDIDAQQCFTPLCPNELPVPEGDLIAQELNRQAQFAKYRIGTKDAHCVNARWVTNDLSKINTKIDHADASNNIDVYWPAHAVPGTTGFELLPGLPKPSDYDFFVWKGIEPDMHPYGACYHDLGQKISTGLVEYLHYHKISHLVVGGLALDFCVQVTALQFLQAGFVVIINLTATRGLRKESTIQAKQNLLEAGAIFINNYKDLTNVLIES